MAKEWSVEELKEVAAQLGKPDGENGIKTADRMAQNNAGMTRRAVEIADLQKGDIILEIGPGNAAHLAMVFGATQIASYTGLDISETMITEASRINEKFIADGRADFVLSNSETIEFDDNYFDAVFTVNTLYFWKDPAQYAGEIRRVLKIGGIFVLAIADKKFMEKLPFTKYDFKLYDKNDAVSLLSNAGFAIDSVTEEVDVTMNNLGEEVSRDVIIIRALKE